MSSRASKRIAACLLLISLTGCGDGATGASSSTVPLPATTTAPDDRATPDPEVLAFVREAVDGLLTVPAVEVRFRMGDGSDAQVRGTAGIDAESLAYTSTETRFDAGGNPIVTAEYVLLGSTVYVRFVPVDEQDADWTEVEVGEAALEYLAAAYAVGGAVVPSLDRIPLLLESIPSTIRPLAGDGQTGYSVTFDSGEISRFYRDSGLELVGSSDAGGETTFEIWAKDGVLVRLRAFGTQFHDGEAIEDVDAVIEYSTVESVQIDVPGT